jgi:hypothetical protein
MLMRALILLIVTSQAWSAGISIEFNTQINFDSLTYTPTDDAEEESLYLPIIEQSTPVPLAVSLPSQDTSEQGVRNFEIQNLLNTGAGQSQFVTLNDDNLYLYSLKDSGLYAYTFDYDGAVDKFEYSDFPGSKKGFALDTRTLDYNGHYPEQTHAWPYVISLDGSAMNFWAVDFDDPTIDGKWWQWSDPAPFEGGFDGYIYQSTHPDYPVKGTTTGMVMSYSNDNSSGLWFDGSLYGEGVVEYGYQQVSSVELADSKLIETHKGLAQFYIEKTGVGKLKFISEIDTAEITFESGDETVAETIHSLVVDTGTLYDIYYEQKSELIWHNKALDTLTVVDIPADTSKITGCKATLERIFCVLISAEKTTLSELVDGIFVVDRIMDHALLTDGFVSINGMYAFEDNRFISITTLDLQPRLFNFTPSASFHTAYSGRSGASIKSGIIDGSNEGTFFWIQVSGSTVLTRRYKVESVNIPVEEVGAPVIVIDLLNNRDGEIEEEEEKEEIPYKEFASSFSFYILFVMFMTLSMRKPRLINSFKYTQNKLLKSK